MRDTFLRLISDDERNALYGMVQEEDDGSLVTVPRSSCLRMKDTQFPR